MDDAERAEYSERSFLNMALKNYTNKIKDLETPRSDRSKFCVDCGAPIPERRLAIFPGALRCTKCQEKLDEGEKS